MYWVKFVMPGSTTHSKCADYNGKKWCATSLKADGSYNGYGYCDMEKCGSEGKLNKLFLWKLKRNLVQLLLSYQQSLQLEKKIYGLIFYSVQCFNVKIRELQISTIFTTIAFHCIGASQNYKWNSLFLHFSFFLFFVCFFVCFLSFSGL